MKRIIAAIMVLVSIMTLSGCKEVPSFMPSYWDGLTKRGTIEFIQDSLREKYGEEFVVKKIAKKSEYSYTDLLAYCSPASDESLVFQMECHNYTYNERDFIDTYIQSIVEKEMSTKLDSVISQYYTNYVLQVNVHGLAYSYDSGILSSDEATIKNYTEHVPDNVSIIDIILNEQETNNLDNIKNILDEFTTYIHKTIATIRCYRVPDDVLITCKENSRNVSMDNDVELIVSGRFPEYTFKYNGQTEELTLVNKFLCD